MLSDWWTAHKFELLVRAALFAAIFVGFGVWFLFRYLRKK